ncbi:MAG: hypothetical protein U0232_00080 [Thermomicrobiales bacterium]
MILRIVAHRMRLPEDHRATVHDRSWRFFDGHPTIREKFFAVVEHGGTTSVCQGMPVPIIAQDASLATVLEENTITLARLKANPITSDLAQDFTSFHNAWIKVNAQEINLRVAVVTALAEVAVVDETLDPLVDALAAAVLLVTKNDRKAPLYQLYFGAKRPSELKRPVLGAELDTVRGFIPSLVGSSIASLVTMGNQIADVVNLADQALAKLALAEQMNRDFRAVGERKALIDQFNALRKVTYGKLSEMPHALPDEHLPATFAEQFFRHDKSRSNGSGKPLGIEDLEEMLKAKQAELKALEEEIGKAKEKEAAEAAAKQKAEIDADKAALEEAEKQAAEAAAKVQALKNKLAQPS